MSRQQRCRRICKEPKYSAFTPIDVKNPEHIILSVDEYEVIRLVDYENKNHEQCAEIMDISRTTVTEIYKKARFKIAEAFVMGKELNISGGNYRICNGPPHPYCSETCRILSSKEKKKGRENNMKIAVTYQNGEIFQHFGHTEQFKVYEAEDGKIIKSEIVDSNGAGHGALAGFLLNSGVDVLICGGIGGGAQTALAEAGIKLYGGVSGSADEAAEAFLAGRLDYNPDVHCDHHNHEEGHSCGDHGCGSHSCHE